MVRLISAVLAGFSLLICLVVPVLYFLGDIDAESYNDVFLGASLGWFVFALIWQVAGKNEPALKQ